MKNSVKVLKVNLKSDLINPSALVYLKNNRANFLTVEISENLIEYPYVSRKFFLAFIKRTIK